MFGIRPLPRSHDAALRDAAHASASVRASAMADLARLVGDADDVPLTALVEALHADRDPSVRVAAALGLAELGAAAPAPALLKALSDSDARVREYALLALGERGERDRELARAVEPALGDVAPPVRFQALLALHRLQGGCSEAALIGASRDSDPELRQLSFRLAEAALLEAASAPSEAVRQRARAALRDDAPGVRLAAAILLARVGDLSGSSVLVAAAGRELGSSSLEDQQEALELCGELGLEAARSGLERRAFGRFGFSNDALAWHARVALARMGDPRAKRLIVRNLSALTRETRTLAVAAAGRARLSEARALLERMTAADADPEALARALAELGSAA